MKQSVSFLSFDKITSAMNEIESTGIVGADAGVDSGAFYG
jgi:hypothetical protein